ncbi:MAG: 2-oxo acid dehydrogenase subunit E2 [Planctomycetes bacterium]|nr:2-oxo acid dehydrogenase subunit E2 [Planctomycetota bacterium]
MALEFKLPDIGEGIAEGEIVKWLVKVGDVVKEHQSIVEVMTDKATVEVPAPAGGKITAIKAKEGDTVPVGSVIFVLDTAASGASSAPAAPKPAAAPAPAPAKAPAAPAKAAPAPAPAAAPVSGGASLEFKLPDIGEGVTEGEIVKWLVKAGDVVKEHQSVVEVMTDKATVEVPAPAGGTITKLHVKDGQTVPVGTVLFSLATAGAATAKPAAAPVAAAAPARAPAMAMAGAPAAVARASEERVLAAPSARRVARELGIDLHSVAGSGRNGVVRRADVESFAQNGASRSAAAAPSAAPTRPQYAPITLAPGERETRVPFRGVRRKIAEAMVRSKFTAPHFTVVEEVDITQLVALKDQAKAMHAASGVKITFMPFIMKATAMALAQHPMLNAHLDEGAQEIVRYGYVNLGIAMDTDNGLIVPVVKNVDSKSILQIAAELAELAERTRAGKVKPDELKGSTFSITNAGNIGGTLATPIINYPDVAILGVHRIMKKPGVVETSMGDRIEVRQYMNFSCSVDHRLADGADGARFLVLLKKFLENPGLLAL